jgi:hypothetical protein
LSIFQKTGVAGPPSTPVSDFGQCSPGIICIPLNVAVAGGLREHSDDRLASP